LTLKYPGEENEKVSKGFQGGWQYWGARLGGGEKHGLWTQNGFRVKTGRLIEYLKVGGPPSPLGTKKEKTSGKSPRKGDIIRERNA